MVKRKRLIKTKVRIVVGDVVSVPISGGGKVKAKVVDASDMSLYLVESVKTGMRFKVGKLAGVVAC